MPLPNWMICSLACKRQTQKQTKNKQRMHHPNALRDSFNSYRRWRLLLNLILLFAVVTFVSTSVYFVWSHGVIVEASRPIRTVSASSSSQIKVAPTLRIVAPIHVNRSNELAARLYEVRESFFCLCACVFEAALSARSVNHFEKHRCVVAVERPMFDERC